MLDVAEVILRYVQQNGKVTSKQIIEHTGLPRSTVLKEISKLTNAGKLDAVGKPPREVFYQLAQTLTQEVPVDKPIEPPPGPPKTAPAPQKPPEGGGSTPSQSSLPSKEELARNSDDFLRRNLSEGGYNLVVRLFNGCALIWGLWKTKFLVRRWVIGTFILAVGVMGYEWLWLPWRQNKLAWTQQEFEQTKQHLADSQNELAQTKQELEQSRQQLAQQQKDFENQIKALQQQASPAYGEASENKPVDYQAIVQHPFTSNESINFFKGLFHKPKAAVAQQVVSPPNVSVGGPGLATSRSPTKALGDDKAVKQWQEQLSQAQSQIDQLQNQIKQLQEQLKGVMATSEATKQSNEKEMASQKALAMTQKDQIEHLTQENKRLNDRYENEEGINQDLENKLKAVMAEKGQVSTEKDFSIQFDENGDRVK